MIAGIFTLMFGQVSVAFLNLTIVSPEGNQKHFRTGLNQFHASVSILVDSVFGLNIACESRILRDLIDLCSKHSLSIRSLALSKQHQPLTGAVAISSPTRFIVYCYPTEFKEETKT